MPEQEKTPLSTADVKRRYSWGMAPHKSIPGGMYTVAAAAADFDRWLAAHDAEVRADERAKRPDREHLAQMIAKHRIWSMAKQRVICACGWRGTRDVHELHAADAVLALEPEAREEHRPVDIEPSDTVCAKCSRRQGDGTYAETVEWPCALAEAREDDEDQLNRAEHEPLAYDGTHVGGPDYNEVRPTVIARLEVTRGALTEYPIAEKVRGGWQNGVTFYPDADVTQVKVPYAPAPEAREVTDAERAAALAAVLKLVELHPRTVWDAIVNTALEAAREVSRG